MSKLKTGTKLTQFSLISKLHIFPESTPLNIFNIDITMIETD